MAGKRLTQLRLAARQWGYWHAVPEGAKEPRIRMVHPSASLGMPDLGAAGYLVDCLFDVGPTMHGAMGEVPLSWTEVVAYAQGSGAVSEQWEIRALVEMSKSYLAEKATAVKPLATPPTEQADD